MKRAGIKLFQQYMRIACLSIIFIIFGTIPAMAADSFNVTYDANGGTNAPIGVSYSAGSVVLISSQGSMTKNGDIFLGWNTSKDDADNGIVQYSSTSTNVSERYFFMPSNDVILYAVWGTLSPEPIIFEVVGIASGEILRDYNYMMIDDPLSLGGPGLYSAIEDIIENQRRMLSATDFTIDDDGHITNLVTILNDPGFYANNGNAVQLNPADTYVEENGFSIRQYSSNPYGIEIMYLQDIPYAGFTVSDFEMNEDRTVTQINSVQTFSPVAPSINIEVVDVVQTGGAGWFNQVNVTVDDPEYYVLKYNFGPTGKADKVPNFFEIRRVSDERVEALYNGDHSTFTFYNYEATYSVTYEAPNVDGGTIPLADTDEAGGATYILSTGEPTRTESTFLGWQSDISGDTIIYKTGTPNDNFTMPSADVILTAQWNSFPSADDDDAITNVNTPVIIDVLDGDTDPENDILTIIQTGIAVQGGTVNIVHGQVVYIPPHDFVGRDKFTYIITDPSGGTATATVVVSVQSATLDDPNARVIKVEGDIFYVTDESPIQGVEMTLYSTPKRGITNVDGYFNLGYTSEGNHTLVAEWSPGEEIGRIPTNFRYGVYETYTLNTDGSLDITYNDNTEYIFLRLQIPRSTGIIGVRPVNGVVFIHKSDAMAINPQTGDESNWYETIIYMFREFMKLFDQR